MNFSIESRRCWSLMLLKSTELLFCILDKNALMLSLDIPAIDPIRPEFSKKELGKSNESFDPFDALGCCSSSCSCALFHHIWLILSLLSWPAYSSFLVEDSFLDGPEIELPSDPGI